MNLVRGIPEGKEVLGPYHRFTATLQCWVGFCHPEHRCEYTDRDRPLVEGHHDRTRAAGGEDYGNEIPLCQLMHFKIHELGKPEFERRFKVSVTAGLWYVRSMWHYAQNPIVWLPLRCAAGKIHQATGPFYTACGLYGEMVEPAAGAKVDCHACHESDRF